jgi:activator of 2-hydroxyglutaryl-CoA dehydratase
MTIRIGIDVGSTTTEAVAVNASCAVVAQVIEPGDPRVAEQARRMLEALRDQVGAGKDVPIVATGYGCKLVPLATRKVAEIWCHARGAYHLVGREGAMIDVGGQDTKVIRLGPGGAVANGEHVNGVVKGLHVALADRIGGRAPAIGCAGRPRSAVRGPRTAALPG